MNLVTAQRLGQQHVTEIVVTVLRDLGLLFRVAVVLERKYDRIVGRFERRLGDRLDHLPSRHLGNERVPMKDDRFVGLAIPQVQFDTPASG